MLILCRAAWNHLEASFTRTWSTFLRFGPKFVECHKTAKGSLYGRK